MLLNLNPNVRNFSARNSGARNGCANLLGGWDLLVLSAGKPHAHKIPPFRGGSGLFYKGGGSANFIVGIFWRVPNPLVLTPW